MKKTVGNYIISTIKQFEGSHSIFYKVIKDEKKLKNENKQLIAKCIKKQMGNLISDLLHHEQENAIIYSKSNSTTKLVDRVLSTNNIYNIYEFYEAITLEEYMKSNKLNALQLKEKIELSIWIIKALSSLHENEAIHRNLNPSHILVDFTNKEVKFCGNSSIYNFQLGFPKNTESKMPYKPPETQETIDQKQDIYSLGIILYEIFSNHLIDSDFIISKIAIEEMKNISPGIKELINKCTDPNPANRPFAKELLLSKFFEPENEEAKSINNTTELQINDYQIFKEENQLLIKTLDSLNQYIETEICYGEGSYAIVKQIKDKNTHKIYAMKKIPCDLLANIKIREQIFLEIDILKSVINCPFIVKYIEHFYYDGFLCIVLEECNGGDLKTYIDSLYLQKQSLKSDEIQLIAWNIAEGLYYLHEKKYIVHRDIKPQNILLIKNEKNIIVDAKIADFGLSKQLSNNEDTFSSVWRTIPYMAPEMKSGNINNLKLTNKVDTYAFGAFLAFIAFRVSPIKCNQNENISMNKFFNRFPEYEIRLPPYAKMFTELHDLIERCLRADPLERLDIKEVLSHDYFNKFSPEAFYNKYNLNLEKILNYTGHKSAGFLENGKYWVKCYNEGNSNQELSKYIKREIQFLMRCKSIPHIIQLLDFGIINNNQAIIEVFEYYNGGNLLSLINNRGREKYPIIFQKEEIKIVAKCVLEFLEVLHSKNYLHRSINPKHVLTTLNEKTGLIMEAVVCGFGKSKSCLFPEDSLVFYSELDEDYLYIDIDTIERNYYTSESDIWSLGMVIYFMIVGSPFIKSRKEIEILKKTHLFKIPDNLDKELEMILKFCTKSWIPNEFSSMSINDFLANSNIFHN